MAAEEAYLGDYRVNVHVSLPLAISKSSHGGLSTTRTITEHHAEAVGESRLLTNIKDHITLGADNKHLDTVGLGEAPAKATLHLLPLLCLPAWKLLCPQRRSLVLHVRCLSLRCTAPSSLFLSWSESSLSFDMDFPQYLWEAGRNRIDVMLQPSWTWSASPRPSLFPLASSLKKQ